MPYKSDKQERLMRAVAHSPSFAKKVGISQSVGQKFEAHKAEGGTVKDSAMKKIFAGKETPAEERKEKTAAKKAGMSYKAAERKFEGEKYCGGGKTGYADGGRVNPGVTPDMPDSEDQLRPRTVRKAKPIPPRRINPGLTPDLADSKEQERGYKKGGSVRGVGAAKRGYGCTGRK